MLRFLGQTCILDIMSFSFCLIETRSKDWTDIHQKMIKNQYIFSMQFICSFYVFFPSMPLITYMQSYQTVIKHMQFWKLYLICIETAYRCLPNSSQKHAISDSFRTGIWQKETPQSFGHHGKLRHIYSGIHSLAMPEICRFSLKTFKAVWVWKRSIQFANWLGLFVAPWFIHQKSMQDSLKHF